MPGGGLAPTSAWLPPALARLQRRGRSCNHGEGCLSSARGKLWLSVVAWDKRTRQTSCRTPDHNPQPSGYFEAGSPSSFGSVAWIGGLSPAYKNDATNSADKDPLFMFSWEPAGAISAKETLFRQSRMYIFSSWCKIYS